MTVCIFCGKEHIEYGDREVYEISLLAKKSSYELLILILKDMKKYIHKHRNEPTLRDSVVCFCKYSMLICEEGTQNKKNGFTDFYNVIFTGVIKLVNELDCIELIGEFIDDICRKLWVKHEELLSHINTEQSEKFNHAC